MQTLVTDPFKDDAAEMLEWLYGVDARVIFSNAIIYDYKRVGQAFMNTVCRYDPEGYQRILGSLGDPFYDDRKLWMALDILTSK